MDAPSAVGCGDGAAGDGDGAVSGAVSAATKASSSLSGSCATVSIDTFFSCGLGFPLLEFPRSIVEVNFGLSEISLKRCDVPICFSALEKLSRLCGFD